MIIAERYNFYRESQKEGQSSSDFLAALREKAKHCEFGDKLEEQLRDRFVCGLRKENIQRRLLTEADLTLTRAIEIAESMVLAETDNKKFHDPSNVHKLMTKKKQAKSPNSPKAGFSGNFNGPQSTNRNQNRTSKGGTNDNQQKQMCYRCGDTRHLAHDCRFQTA